MTLLAFLCFKIDIPVYSSKFQSISIINHVYRSSLVTNHMFWYIIVCLRLYSLALESFHQYLEKFKGHLIEHPWCLNVPCKVSSKTDGALVKAELKVTFWWLVSSEITLILVKANLWAWFWCVLQVSVKLITFDRDHVDSVKATPASVKY